VAGIDLLFAPGGLVEVSLSSVGELFSGIVDSVGTIGFDFISTLQTWFVAPVENIATTVMETFDSIKTKIKEFVDTDLGAALTSLGTTLTQSLVNPFIDALNDVLHSLQSLINSAIMGLPGIVRKGLSLDPVSIPDIPHFARGGMANRGLAMVGERGPELVNFGGKAQIFPANLTRALMSMSAQPMPVGGGNTSNATYNQQRSVSNTFNNVNPQQSVLMARQMEAGYRR